MPPSLSNTVLCALSACPNAGSKSEAVAAEQLQPRTKMLQSSQEACPLFLWGPMMQPYGGGRKEILTCSLKLQLQCHRSVWVGNTPGFKAGGVGDVRLFSLPPTAGGKLIGHPCQPLHGYGPALYILSFSFLCHPLSLGSLCPSPLLHSTSSVAFEVK